MAIQMKTSPRARSKDGAPRPREHSAVRARMAHGAGGPLLVCYDGSDDAKYAIETAATLFPGGRAVVVSVWQRLAGLDSIAWAGEPAGMVNSIELDRAAAERGSRLAEEGARIAHGAGLDAEPLAIEALGPIWKTIVEAGAAHDASAIVIGSRGLEGLRAMLLGSVSSAVVHHAGRPTLVIHRPADHTSEPAEP
jgi:nucleotide-binding universal stress UspA family protein